MEAFFPRGLHRYFKLNEAYVIKIKLLLVYFFSAILLNLNILWAEESPSNEGDEKSKKLNHYNIKILLGVETPGEGTRLDQGLLFKTFLYGGNILKYSTSFNLSAAKEYVQGEFSIGGQLYPLDFYKKSFVQPFFYLEATLGIGSYNKLTRIDGGHNLGVGLDIDFYKNYGLGIIVESHNALEKSLRILVGLQIKDYF
ncbi:MAG: hypothetical protein CME68_11320 [Halobacteriovoraceae bacterium]|nr:hypothetical protein [Halobacteriovoraceae bacterium]